MWTATLRGSSPYGNPVYRVVYDNLRIMYVTIPWKRSTNETVTEVIDRAVAEIHRPPRPIR